MRNSTQLSTCFSWIIYILYKDEISDQDDDQSSQHSDVHLSGQGPATVSDKEDVESSKYSYIHQNPKVIDEINNFEQREMMHEVDTCTVCRETRPIFHITKSSGGASLQKEENTLVKCR